ncbi:MAG: hypothetical protein ACRD2X_26240, partial [Vicinamibacteraceae bacterium]
TVLSRRGVRDVGTETRSVAIGSGEYVIASWAKGAQPSSPAVATDGKAWQLPYGFIGVTRDGREVRFRPVVESSGGLFLASDASEFEGLIHVGVQDLRDPSAAYELPEPINLLISAAAHEVSPRQLAIRHTSLPFADVAIRARDPADSLQITVQASGTRHRAALSLQIVRPRLELSIERPRIQGFGLETSAVTVRARGLAEPGGRIVTLTSGLGAEPVGSLQEARVELDGQGVGGTSVRSASVGTSTVTVSSPPLVSAGATITFAWPVTFLVAAVLGGVIGAYLGRRRLSRKDQSRGSLYVVGVGALTGIVAVVLYAVGVNVLPVQPVATAGEALVFAVAAVAGYVGLRL